MPLRDDQVADIRGMHWLKSRTGRVYSEGLDGKARREDCGEDKTGHAVALLMLDGHRGAQVIGRRERDARSACRSPASPPELSGSGGDE